MKTCFLILNMHVALLTTPSLRNISIIHAASSGKGWESFLNSSVRDTASLCSTGFLSGSRRAGECLTLALDTSRRSTAARGKKSHSPLSNHAVIPQLLILSNPSTHPLPEIQPEHRCWEAGYSRCKAALFEEEQPLWKEEQPLLGASPPSKMRELGLQIRDSKSATRLQQDPEGGHCLQKTSGAEGNSKSLEHSPSKWRQGRGWSNAPDPSSGWGTHLSAAH